RAPRDLHDEPREEIRDRRDVTVDAFDQLPRAMRGVERAVQRQNVAQKISTQSVRRTPSEVAGDVPVDDARHLGRERDREVDDAYTDQITECGARLRAVDEDLRDQRVRKLGADPKQ